MGMDTRTTNQMSMLAQSFVYSTPVGYERSYPYGLLSYTPLLGTNGWYKQVVSERSGKFFPGKFRANPCILRDIRAQVVKGFVRCKPSDGAYIEWIGDLWNKPLWETGSLYNGDFNSGYGTWNQSYANLAQVKALSKLKDAEFDAGTALGELKETLNLLRNPFSALTNEMLKIYKHGRKVNKTASLLDALSGGWLTYRYGIIPLMLDIQNIIQLCEKKLRQIEGMQRESGGLKHSSNFVTKIDNDLKIGDITRINSTTVFEFERVYKTTHHCYFLRSFESQDLATMRMLGMHPSQFTSILWELTRLSFVVDWFIAVGDWLRAFSPDPTVSFLGHCVSQKIETTIKATMTRVSSPYGLDTTKAVVLPSYWAHSSILERRVVTAGVVFPPFNPNFFTVKRLLDSLALVWALLPIRK